MILGYPNLILGYTVHIFQSHEPWREVGWFEWVDMQQQSTGSESICSHCSFCAMFTPAQWKRHLPSHRIQMKKKIINWCTLHRDEHKFTDVKSVCWKSLVQVKDVKHCCDLRPPGFDEILYLLEFSGEFNEIHGGWGNLIKTFHRLLTVHFLNVGDEHVSHVL